MTRNMRSIRRLASAGVVVLTVVAATGIPSPAAAGRTSSRESRRGEAEDKLGAFVIFFDGEDQVTMDGDMDDIDVARAARRKTGADQVIWFRWDGRAYVIADAATVDSAQTLYKPMQVLGERQGDLGSKQGALGRKQGDLGRRQGELGLEQARIGARQAALHAQIAERRSRDRDTHDLEEQLNALEDRRAELSDAQEALGAEQSRYGEVQSELGELQSELGALQEEASGIARAGLSELIEAALESGLAKPAE
jgi:bla regulator protein BlaR1